MGGFSSALLSLLVSAPLPMVHLNHKLLCNGNFFNRTRIYDRFLMILVCMMLYYLLATPTYFTLHRNTVHVVTASGLWDMPQPPPYCTRHLSALQWQKQQTLVLCLDVTFYCHGFNMLLSLWKMCLILVDISRKLRMALTTITLASYLIVNSCHRLKEHHKARRTHAYAAHNHLLYIYKVKLITHPLWVSLNIEISH